MSASTTPRFNHVALTVEPELLDASGRRALLDFYREVFGWNEVEQMTLDRERLVLQCHRFDQFVYLVAGAPVTRCAALDHFGLAVASLPELEQIIERAAAYRERDPGVELSEQTAEEHPGVRIHSVYVRYRLPMSIEIQHFEPVAAAGCG